MKKRTNIIVDEELLERARRATGEKTYSGAITKALEDIIRRHRAVEAYKKFEQLAHSKEGFFDPQYLAEKDAKSLSRRQPQKRISAHEARAPKGGVTRRGSR